MRMTTNGSPQRDEQDERIITHPSTHPSIRPPHEPHEQSAVAVPPQWARLRLHCVQLFGGQVGMVRVVVRTLLAAFFQLVSSAGCWGGWLLDRRAWASDGCNAAQCTPPHRTIPKWRHCRDVGSNLGLGRHHSISSPWASKVSRGAQARAPPEDAERARVRVT